MAEIAIVDTPPPPPPPAPTTSIRVSQMPTPIDPAEVKPGSAMSRFRESLRAKAGTGSPAAAPAAPASPPAASTPPESPPEGLDEPSEVPTTEGEGSPPAAPPSSEPETPPAAPAAKKLTAWQVAEQYKTEAKRLRKELDEAKALVTPETDRKVLLEKVQAIEKRNQELENEIRYKDYSKSEEFKTKYEQPYNDAWKRAMADLKEVEVNTGEGVRAIAATDLLELVNMPLARAREVARNAFGESAEDVLAYRKEIKRLAEEQDNALTKARVEAGKREEAKTVEATTAQKVVADEIKTNWEKVKQTTLADKEYGKYFNPVEGDEQGNQRLAKGMELAARAFSENPNDPRLTAEQRAGIIKRHSAVYYRAAAFGRLVYQNSQKDATIAQLTKELQQFRASTPPTSGSSGVPPAVSGSLKPWDRMRAELAKRAK